MVRALALLVVVGLGSVAAAQPDPEGARLFEQGRALAKDGNYAEACEKFEKSLALDRAIGTQLNYADCNEKLGRLAEAWRLFDAASDAEKITNPTRAKFARERADVLLPKVGVIVLNIAAPAAASLAISIGGRLVNPAAVVREVVDPGSVSVSVTASTGTLLEKTETVAAGQSVTFDVPAVAPTSTVIETMPPDPKPTVRRRSRVHLSYGVAGAGLLSLIGGVLVGLKANSNYDAQFENGECTQAGSDPVCMPAGFKALNQARTLAQVGTVLGVGGLVLMAGGAVLFLTAPRDIVLIPTASAQWGGLAVVGSF